MTRNFLYGLIGLVVIVAVVLIFVATGAFRSGAAPGGVREQVSSNPGAAPTATATAFRYDAAAYPSLQPVLQPRSRDEFMTAHSSDTAFGEDSAPVTIIEFFSYACPHCARFHRGTYQNILSDYIDTGRVRYVKRDYLLNREVVAFEMRAGAGFQCLIDQAQRERFADLVFDQQEALASAPNPIEALVPVFQQAGLEEVQARACMTDALNLSLVFGRAGQALNIAGVQGTPTLFINGERYQGSTDDYTSLKRAIDLALLQAG